MEDGAFVVHTLLLGPNWVKGTHKYVNWVNCWAKVGTAITFALTVASHKHQSCAR